MPDVDPEWRARRTKAQREWRARKREREAVERGDIPRPITDPPSRLATVTVLHPLEQPREHMSVVEAVEAELNGTGVAARRPADVENAVRMAMILDNPGAWTQWSLASNRLKSLMDSLRAGEANSGSRLAQFRQARAVGS